MKRAGTARNATSVSPPQVGRWREKRGEATPEDLSGNLIVQLGAATEQLNRSWYEHNTTTRVVHHRDQARRDRLR